MQTRIPNQNTIISLRLLKLCARFDRIESQIDFMQFENAKAIIVIYELRLKSSVFYCVTWMPPNK